MSLRCLLFSGDEGAVRSIRQALVELGVAGEDCSEAGEALDKAKSGQFQVVITDWDCQPAAPQVVEAARDLATRQRPLILAVVTNNDEMQAALKAGANSTLRRPLDARQVRDTLGMARDLLRAKMAPPLAGRAVAAAAAAGPVRGFLAHDPEKQLRTGEFLQNARSEPGAQFSVEADPLLPLQSAEAEAVERLVELEPMAAAMNAEPAKQVSVAVVEPRHQAHGPEAAAVASKTTQENRPNSLAALLQARRQALAAAAAPEAKDGEETGLVTAGSSSTRLAVEPDVKEKRQQASEAALFSYIAGKKEQDNPNETGASEPQRKARPLILASALALVVAMAAAKLPPRLWKQNIVLLYGSSLRAGRNWLNPPAVKPVEPPASHETFERAGDEYKFPAIDPIPDATTDPAEIRVVPVLDPTIKTNPATPPGTQDGAAPARANEGTDTPDVSKDAASEVKAGGPPDHAPGSGGAPNLSGPRQPPASTSTGRGTAAGLAGQARQNPAQASPPNQAIPLSLRSQLAQTGPDPGGVKPAEAALPSIEPVNLAESVARTLVLQQVEPVYPQTVSASAQRGTVTLAVTVGRDGSVQDTKFLQGALSFARSATEAVRQWRFRPYLMNGRPVAVQTMITLSFKPPV